MNITTKCRNSKLLRMFRFTCTSHVHFQQLCQLVILTFSNEHDENNSLKTKFHYFSTLCGSKSVRHIHFIITKFIIIIKFYKDLLLRILLGTEFRYIRDFTISVFVLNKFYCTIYCKDII